MNTQKRRSPHRQKKIAERTFSETLKSQYIKEKSIRKKSLVFFIRAT